MKKLFLPALVLLLFFSACQEPDNTRAPEKIDSITRLSEAGTIVAEGSVPVNAPGWGNSQRITWLIAEGENVAIGDTLIRYDTNWIEDYIQRNTDDLDVTQLNMASALAVETANQIRTGNKILKSHLASEKAILEQENRKYEALVARRRAELAYQQAEIGLIQARNDSLVQSTLDSLSITKESLKATKLGARHERLQTYQDQLVSVATASGMVVYTRKYTEEGIKVYRAGDEAVRQDQILEITNTSTMKIDFTVHERDRWRLHDGQTVQVVLDAYTDVIFTGLVENVGRLPLPSADGSVVRRFKATATINENDSRLMPGMSARVIVDLGGSS